MELTDVHAAALLGGGVLILFGLVGALLPGMPGGVLVAWSGVALWAVLTREGLWTWTTLGLASLLALLGLVTKYLLPGRAMRNAGVPGLALLAGGVLGIIGFFVVPVVGLFLGFVAGVFLCELVRLRTPRLAWPATVTALKAVGYSMIVELFFVICIAGAWVAGLVFSA